MKKIAVLILAFVLSVTGVACSGKKDTKNKPDNSTKNGAVQVIKPKYGEDNEIPVVNYIASKENGIAADGVTDDGPAINTLLMSIMMDGGGTLYLPEGKYYLGTMLSIPSNVCIRGEWQSPDKAEAASCGTILIAGKGDTFVSDPVIYMSSNSGLKNITVIYEEQSVAEPKEYYAAVEIGVGRNFTMENITVLGAWTGLKLGPKYNEIFYVHNAFISALSVGVDNSGTSDTSRIEGCVVDPKYWAENSINKFSDDEKKAITDYSKKNSVGMQFKYTDWSMQYGITVRNQKTGIAFLDYIKEDGSSFPANGVFTNTVIENCDTGIYFEQTKINGISFDKLKISTDVQATAGIDTSDIYLGTSQFMNTEISGDFKWPVRNNGAAQSSLSGSLVFVNSAIKDYNDSDNYAVYMNGGTVSLENSSLLGKQKHIKVETEKIQSLSVLGCKFGGTKDISINKAAQGLCNINDDPMTVSETPKTNDVIPEKTYKPASDKLYNTADYGLSTTNDDNTEIVQKALDDARSTGGIVYIPGGFYNIKGNLTVPTGVELRGCYPMQQMGSESGGTMLWGYAGQGDESGKAMISLEAGAGIRGIVFYYPNQNVSGSDTVEYPWTVQGLGNNCYVINSTLTNSYNGIDFGTHPSNGCYVEFVGGSPIRRGVFMGNNDGKAYIRNCQFNPNYAYFLNTNTGNMNYRLYYADAFIFGYNKDIVSFNNFVFQSKNGFMFMAQDGKGTSGLFINPGVDGSECCFRIYDLENIDVVGPQLTAMESVNLKCNVRTEKTFDGTVRFFSGAIWGPTNELIHTLSGTLEFTAINLCTGSCDFFLNQQGGNVKLTATTIHNPQMSVTDNAESLEFAGCFVRTFKHKFEPSGIKNKCTVKARDGWWA